MMLSFRPILAIAAGVAALVLVSSANAQTVPTETIPVNNPSCLDAVRVCTNQNFQGFAHELEITDVTTVASSKCDTTTIPGVFSCFRSDPALGVTVRWHVNTKSESVPGGVDVYDKSPPLSSQQVDLPGFEAVIAEGRSGSNVYCGNNLTLVTDIVAPKQVTPTKITFCWAKGPCGLSPTKVNEACAAYNGPPGDPAQQAAHFLQEHLVAPTQPINICGCPYLGDTNPAPEVVTLGVIQRNAAFCDPSLIFPAPGSCPEGNITALATQGTATSGTNTCQRVISGGRVLYIGDTCF